MLPTPRFCLRLGLAAATLLAGAGCYRRVSYQSVDGRRVEIVNVGFDTKIGSLHAETPNGVLRIENADSQAVVASKLADLTAMLLDDLRKGGRL